MKYGYARVSSRGQAADGNSLDYQERVLREAGAEEIYTEAITGTKRHRPQLDILLNKVTEGDTVIVTKLDRVARSVRNGLDIIDELVTKGVTIHVLNMGVFDNSPQGRLMRTVFLAFAEFERDMIQVRTQEGKALAREKDPDYKEGRKSLLTDDVRRMILEGKTYREIGISKTSYYNYRKQIS